MFRKRKENELHKELLIQIKGLLEIEIGNYIYEKGGKYNLELHIDNYDGIDAYVFDRLYSSINKYGNLEFDDYFMDTGTGLTIDDLSMIAHYHYEDLLYLLMNYQNEKKRILKKVDNYIEWRSHS